MSHLASRIEIWYEAVTHALSLHHVHALAEAIAKEARQNADLPLAEVNKKIATVKTELTKNPRDASRFLIETLALSSVAARHLYGFLPNTTQLAAVLLLTEGKVVELRSGEGKTIVAALAASWLALKGRHVDIATTNDYLAARDQRWMGLLFGTLGIPTGVVLSTTPRQERAREYQKQVTHVANQELGFDYLRDHLALNPHDQVLGKLDFVIIDEVDSVLIDEARTPLVISENKIGVEPSAEFSGIEKFLPIVAALSPGTDYQPDYHLKTASLTEAGAEKVVAKLGKDIFREGTMDELRDLWYALYITLFLERDRDYVVADGKLVLVDEFTGHALPDRRFLDGLQQALEVREKVPPSPKDTVVASINYRNFFKLYHHVAGMTGTAYDARDEFFSLYGLEVIPIRPHKGIHRKDLPTIFFRTREEKLRALVTVAAESTQNEIPLLMVGRSIESAKKCSTLLSEKNIPHQLLHAEVSAQETAVIEAAGKPGVITVATNIAGRGTDIIVDEGVRYSHGLRVIGTEHNMSRRVDEQLRGRSGRQGQFGETQFFASLEDELFQVYGDEALWNQAEKIKWHSEGVTAYTLEEGIERAQESAELRDAQSRFSLARYDELVDHHRQTIYTLREELLATAPPAYGDIVTKEIATFLRHGFHSPMKKDDIFAPFHSVETLQSPIFKEIESALLQNAPLSEKIRSFFSEDLKREILSSLDSVWEKYLESVHWLEDSITITGWGGQDPFPQFVQTADQMFHDMQREWTYLVLTSILKSLT